MTHYSSKETQNRYREIPDNKAWAKTFRRDIIVLLFLSAMTAIGIVFSLWAAAKGIID